MLEDLRGKTALVTGAGKRNGIGYAIAARMAACGAHVVIADLGALSGGQGPVPTAGSGEMAAVATDLTAAHGVRTLAVEVDVSSTGSVAGMAETVGEHFDRIDVLFNNAGASFGVPNAVHTYDEEAWLRTVDVNLHGVYRVSRAVVPLMTAGGSIVNTASRAGKEPPIFNGAYAVAKAGVIMLTRVMARELAGLGIRVNAICPGQIRTDLEKWRFELEARFFDATVEEREQEMCRTIPLNRIGTPDEAARLAVFLASEAAGYMTGQAVNVTGGQLMTL